MLQKKEAQSDPKDAGEAGDRVVLQAAVAQQRQPDQVDPDEAHADKQEKRSHGAVRWRRTGQHRAPEIATLGDKCKPNSCRGNPARRGQAEEAKGDAPRETPAQDGANRSGRAPKGAGGECV
jgi:hypothetical protein